jgi:NADH-quinone oxidoreductase subunit C
MGETEESKQDRIAQRVRDWDADAVAEVIEYRGESTLVVPKSHLRRVCEFLRDSPALRFNFLSDVTGMDRFPVEPRFELNYHLLSIPHRATLRLRLRAHGADPVVPSVMPIWPTANWHEREIFDLFGVRFEGHPNLERLLMPQDWEGHPLRKDYPVEGYR